MAKNPKKNEDRLARYRARRSAERTPEPFAGRSSARVPIFVVQKHAARNLHYDLRLEMDGALQSWAVPRGPSADPLTKRLAIEVEEHPLEYADFEGLIPEGNYGAGAVIVWDRGSWEPIGDPREGLEKGKLLFDLKGFKLRGRWTLFRTKRRDGNPKEWLLMKKPDGHADPEGEFEETSILSGLTVEQLRDGVDPAEPLRDELVRLKAPGDAPTADKIEIMLAEPREQPFSRPGWIFELKYDGYRLLGAREGDRARLRYRRGGDATRNFPEIARAIERLPFDSFVLDGELVVLDDEGKPSFQKLQQRVRPARQPDGSTLPPEPVTLFVFDLLAFDTYDLRPLPLLARKKLLRRVLPRAGPLRYSDHIEEQGEAMFESVREMQLEGLVAKRADAPYRSGRSADWLKLRADRVDDFVVVGYSPSKGSRSGFGALHLAIHDGERLVYSGRVGSGFTHEQLADLAVELDSARRDGPPCEVAPTDPGHVWVEPHLVCEVRFKEWTDTTLLRQPVFLRLRDDKIPEECRRYDALPLPSEPAPPAQPEVRREVSFTNLGKVFWPEEGYTKGDLIEYYRTHRPLDPARFMKRPAPRADPVSRTASRARTSSRRMLPGYAPDWIRTEVMWSEHAQREIHYFICDDEETLLYLINLGTIPLHLWSSRVQALGNPDWCILDLDPKNAPFEHVVEIAREIRSLCREIELDCFIKTSGSTGLHVMLPLGGQCSYEESRTLAELMARIVAGRLREIATIIRRPAARGDRVYIDFLQNGHGRLLVSPYCVRPIAGAPVSTPLRWSEVKKGLDIRRFNIKTVPPRLRRMKEEPLISVMNIRPDLQRLLSRMAERWQGADGSD